MMVVDELSISTGSEWIPETLGHLYYDQGRLQEAEALYERALQGFQNALGPSHQKFQVALKNLQDLKQIRGTS